MNQSPTVTLTADESRQLRDLVRLHGAKAAAQMVGLVDERTLFKAASESPIARLTAEVIRARLDSAIIEGRRP